MSTNITTQMSDPGTFTPLPTECATPMGEDRARCWGKAKGKEITKDLPLSKVEVSAKIVHDIVCEVTIKQVFENNFSPMDTPSMVSYLFPTDSKSTIFSMTAKLSSGIEIEGMAKNKEEAAAEFTATVQESRQAVLLKQIQSDVYQFDIGNVPAGETVEITVGYMTKLEYNTNNEIEFYIPRTMTPRYGGTDLMAMGIERVNYDMKINVDVVTSSRLLGIYSVSHPTDLIVHDIGANETSASFELNIGLDSDGLNQDILVLVQPEDVSSAHAIYEYSSIFKSHALMVSVKPQKTDGDMEGFGITGRDDGNEENDPGPECLFLMDVSKSMTGSNLEMAKTVLAQSVNALPKGTKFNLMTISNRLESFREESIVHDENCLADVGEWISSRVVKPQGADLDGALRMVLGNVGDDLRRNIFVVTPGGVANAKDCIKIVAETCSTAKNTRVFALGIGSGYSSELIDGLATAGRGISCGITDPTQIDAKVEGMIFHAMSSRVEDVKISIESLVTNDDVYGGAVEMPLEFDVFPRKMEHMFYGKRVVFFAVAHQAKELITNHKLNFRITGKESNDKEYVLDVPLDVSMPNAVGGEIEFDDDDWLLGEGETPGSEKENEGEGEEGAGGGGDDPVNANDLDWNPSPEAVAVENEVAKPFLLNGDAVHRLATLASLDLENSELDDILVQMREELNPMKSGDKALIARRLDDEGVVESQEERERVEQELRSDMTRLKQAQPVRKQIEMQSLFTQQSPFFQSQFVQQTRSRRTTACRSSVQQEMERLRRRVKTMQNFKMQERDRWQPENRQRRDAKIQDFQNIQNIQNIQKIQNAQKRNVQISDQLFSDVVQQQSTRQQSSFSRQIANIYQSPMYQYQGKQPLGDTTTIAQSLMVRQRQMSALTQLTQQMIQLTQITIIALIFDQLVMTTHYSNDGKDSPSFDITKMKTMMKKTESQKLLKVNLENDAMTDVAANVVRAALLRNASGPQLILALLCFARLLEIKN